MPRNVVPAWFHQAVFYQVYPQSFFDANNDGIGDIPGLSKKLSYIKDLGCNALWINPWYASPFQDAGYDVSDYYKVAPRYGTNAQAERLFREAKRLGIKVCLDLVPGHTSIEHPWFIESSKHAPNKYSDWFVWTGSAWEGSGSTGLGMESVRGYAERDAAYVTSFFYSQPALNYGFAKPKLPWQMASQDPRAKQVAAEMLKVMKFWLKLGAGGFRVDMAGALIRNDPGQKGTIKLWQGLSRELKKSHPEAVLISEWGVPKRALKAGFDADFMLHFPTPGYNTLFRHGDKSYFHPSSRQSGAQFFKEYLGHRKSAKGLGHIAVPSGNHDMDRIALGRSQQDLKACFAFLLCLPGVPFIYYGDEIGMAKIEGLASKEGGYNRTGSRTPMQWSDGLNKGFSKAAAKKLYLPVDARSSAPNVAAQDAAPKSLLNTVRQLLALRHKHRALQGPGDITLLHDGSQGKPLAYLRHWGRERFLVVVQPKAKAASLDLKRLGASASQELLAENVQLNLQTRGLRLKTKGVGFGLYQLSGK